MKTNICRLMGWGVVAAAVSSVSLTGCQDFFEQESDHIIFADGDHLNNPTDTVYSMMGILQKMQAYWLRGIVILLKLCMPVGLRTPHLSPSNSKLCMGCLLWFT